MLKKLHFLKKAGKIAAALGAPPPNPHWPPAAGGYAPRLLNCCSHSTYVLLLRTAQICWNRSNFNLLSHTWATVSGLPLPSLSPWLKPLVTPLPTAPLPPAVDAHKSVLTYSSINTSSRGFSVIWKVVSKLNFKFKGGMHQQRLVNPRINVIFQYTYLAKITKSIINSVNPRYIQHLCRVYTCRFDNQVPKGMVVKKYLLVVKLAQYFVCEENKKLASYCK